MCTLNSDRYLHAQRTLNSDRYLHAQRLRICLMCKKVLSIHITVTDTFKRKNHSTHCKQFIRQCAQ